MKEYKNFSAEDFVWDDAFRRWVLRPTQDDHAHWTHWLSENPEKAALIQQAMDLVKAVGPSQVQLPESEKNRAITSILNHFDEQPAIGDEKSPWWFVKSFWFRAACVALLLIGFALFFTKKAPDSDYEQLIAAVDGLQEVTNSSDSTFRIKLDDGSFVNLSPGSKLSYPPHFPAAKRIVYLSGDAFFDVAKQPGRPFYVYAGKLVTKVLGTSFHVRSFSGEREAMVSVKTGRVAVFARENMQPQAIAEVNEQNGVVIEPNQQIVLARESIKMTKTIVAEPELIIPGNANLHFDFTDCPVSEIFKTLHKAYGIEIIFDENTMKHCPVTATLTDLSLYDQLDLVCNAVQATYNVIDGRIVVDGKGCESM